MRTQQYHHRPSCPRRIQIKFIINNLVYSYGDYNQENHNIQKDHDDEARCQEDYRCQTGGEENYNSQTCSEENYNNVQACS